MDKSAQHSTQINPQKGDKPMAYSPQLPQISSATLRRLAWYVGKPMTKSLEMLIELTATKMAEVRP